MNLPALVWTSRLTPEQYAKASDHVSRFYSLIVTPVWLRGEILASEIPDDRLRRGLEIYRDELSAALMPARSDRKTLDVLKVSVAGLLGRFPNARGEPSQAVQAYVDTLCELPAWSVAKVCSLAARGKIDGLSLDFAPAVPRLYAEAEKNLAELRMQKMRVERVLAAKRESESSPVMADRARKAIAGVV